MIFMQNIFLIYAKEISINYYNEFNIHIIRLSSKKIIRVNEQY